MKKIFAITMSLCLILTVFCVTSFASYECMTAFLYAELSAGKDGKFSEDNNKPEDNSPVIEVKDEDTLEIIDCTLGDSEVKDKNKSAGSMFADGSLVVIIAFVALIVSIAALLVNATGIKNKNRAVLDESEDSEAVK